MANKIKTDTFYGGSNQIARLPYKTIDALQQLGLYVENNNDILTIMSECQDISPNKSVNIGIDIDNSLVKTDSLNATDIYIWNNNEDSYHDLFNDVIKVITINKALMTNDTQLTTDEVKTIRSALYNGSVMLVGSDYSKVFITDVSGSGTSANFTGVGIRRSLSGSYTRGDIAFWELPINRKVKVTTYQQQYLTMSKMTTTAGDVCYISCVSSTGSATDYTKWKRALIGSLKTAEGTAITALTGVYPCSGYNAGKIIIGLDLGENKLIYSDGTTSTDALTTNNTTFESVSYGLVY